MIEEGLVRQRNFSMLRSWTIPTKLGRVVALSFAFLALTFGVCKAQSHKKSTESDLSRFSSGELKSCFDDLKVCGAHDIYAISDELTHRLPKLPSEELVQCFDDWKICGVGEDHANGWPISDELARRGNPRSLLVRYWNEPKWTIRGGIEHVAYHFHDPEVAAFMRRVLSERPEDGEDLYWPVNYLAKIGDSSALKELGTGRYRNQGCMQYQTSVALFGKWKYRPAIPYLVETAQYDFCGNIIDAAEESLRALYPHSPSYFDKLEDMQRYFCARAQKEGFQVHCEAK
jgi:hypothetical protein